MNIMGKACNRSHDYPGAWKNGACTIICAFPRASAGPPGKQPKGGFCALGAECRYLHKYARLTRLLRRANARIVYALTFNPTLGYPGEGPITIVSYNINGAGRDTGCRR